MRTGRCAVWLLLGFVGLLSVPLAAQTLPSEQPCPTIDRATFGRMMQIAADAIAEGKTRAVTFRAVRRWCKAQEPPIVFSVEERDCWHSIVGDLPTLATAPPTPSLAEQLSRLLADPPCSTSDRAVFDEARRRIADGLSSGKGRVEVWKAVRSWIKSRDDIPSKFQHCAKAIFDVEYQPYKKAADEAAEHLRQEAERRRQEKEKAEYPEWYALTPEEQARILDWLKRPAVPSLPPLQFTEWSEHGSKCSPLVWTVRTRKIGDVGRIHEPARVWQVIDADTMTVSIGSHQTECKSRRSGSGFAGGRTHWGPREYYREHFFGAYDERITSIVVDGVSTEGLVFNADLDGSLWGSMRVARTTVEFGETMYVIEPTTKHPGALMAVRVPPTVLQAHGLR